MIGDRSANLRAKFVSGCLAETMLKQEIIPADDGVLNEAVAGLGDLLFSPEPNPGTPKSALNRHPISMSLYVPLRKRTRLNVKSIDRATD